MLYYPIIPLVRDFLNLLIGFFFKLSKQCALVLPTFKGVIYYRPVSVVDAYFLPLNSLGLSCVGFMKTSADRKLKGSLVSLCNLFLLRAGLLLHLLSMILKPGLYFLS